MSGSTRRWLVSTVPVAVLAAASLVGAASVRAQDATPAGMAGMGEPHPGHIHSGTCAELGDVVFPLEDAVAPDMMGTPMAGMDAAMASPEAGMGEVVAVSVSTVEASLDDILAAEHAINFHESAENIQNYIACGDLSGTPEDGVLEIDLEELNDSGYEGRAMLEDNGDGTTAVTVELMSAGGGNAAASGAADAATTAVDIAEFAYDPAEITVAVGDTVSWTNSDPVPHTATAQDRETLQSGTIASGDSYEQTFDTAGTYDYFCEFHPNMQGTVVVE